MFGKQEIVFTVKANAVVAHEDGLGRISNVLIATLCTPHPDPDQWAQPVKRPTNLGPVTLPLRMQPSTAQYRNHGYKTRSPRTQATTG